MEQDPDVLLHLYDLVLQYCEQSPQHECRPQWKLILNCEITKRKNGNFVHTVTGITGMSIESGPHCITDKNVLGTVSLAPWCYCKDLLQESIIYLRTLKSIHLNSKNKRTQNSTSHLLVRKHMLR